jgi:HSP90 family molecular chaperone
MEDMMRMYMPDAPAAGAEATLLLNIASPIVARLADGSYGERAESVAKEVYLLAVLANRRFTAEEMKGFLRDSYGLLESL